MAALTAPVGVILAGGESSRFGGAKGLERVGGLRIIDRVAAALKPVVSELLLAANHRDADAWIPGLPVVWDIIPRGGGLSGLHAALSQLQRPVLVVAWDMPFVTAGLLQALATRSAMRQTDASVPVSDSPVGMEPLCACYALTSLGPLERALRAGEFVAARFVRRLARVEWLTAQDVRAFGDPAQLFFSVNTREDLARAEAMAAVSD